MTIYIKAGVAPPERRRLTTHNPQTVEARHLLVWRDGLIGDLWRPGRRNAPTLRAELRRTEASLCDIYWPHWAEWRPTCGNLRREEGGLI